MNDGERSQRINDRWKRRFFIPAGHKGDDPPFSLSLSLSLLALPDAVSFPALSLSTADERTASKKRTQPQATTPLCPPFSTVVRLFSLPFKPTLSLSLSFSFYALRFHPLDPACICVVGHVCARVRERVRTKKKEENIASRFRDGWCSWLLHI